MSSNNDSQKARRIHAGRRGIYYNVVNGKRRYEFGYTDENGRQRWKTVDGNLEDAEAARAATLGQKREGHSVAPNRERFGEFSRAWMERQAHLALGTEKQYRGMLRTHLSRFDGLLLKAIDEDRVLAMLTDMRRKNLSPSTQTAAASVLKLVLDDAERKRLIPYNPVKRLPRRDKPRHSRPRETHLNADEIRRLLSTPIGGLYPESEVRGRVLIATAVYSGLRISELVGLTWGNIDLEHGDIQVTHQLCQWTKERRSRLKSANGYRTIHIMPELVSMLREYKLRVRAAGDGDPVFASIIGHAGIAMHQVDARKAFTLACKSAGIEKPGLVFHSLRHTYASILVAQGHDMAYVADQLGDTIAMVEKVYAHLFGRERHAQKHRAGMSAEFGATLDGKFLESSDGQARVIPLPRRAS